MIDADAWVRHLGPRVAHVTAASNVSGIMQHGLLSAAALARATAAGDIALRADRRRLVGGGFDAVLNHQRPILHGLTAAARIVEDHTPASWAGQLDRRVFFWPEAKGQAFAQSVGADVPSVVLWLDTKQLIAHCGEALELSPINSWNFKQGGARAQRGDWLYVPMSRGLAAFKDNRLRRGLKTTPDTVAEISSTTQIPAHILRTLLVDSQPV